MKTRQRQDSDKTVLLLAMREKQNIDTKRIRPEQNIDESEQQSRRDTSTKRVILIVTRQLRKLQQQPKVQHIYTGSDKTMTPVIVTRQLHW